MQKILDPTKLHTLIRTELKWAEMPSVLIPVNSLDQGGIVLGRRQITRIDEATEGITRLHQSVSVKYK
jgi:hypothetical protein